MKKKVFIDGSSGTTGLGIIEKIKKIKSIELLSIPSRHRKNLTQKIKVYQKSDLVILCLPDEEAREAVRVIKKEPQLSALKVLDASSSHRTSLGWVYGFSELPGQRALIEKARFVSNPGCYAIGFISLIRPLVDEEIISPTTVLSCFGVSGYSGGGKKMIATYEGNKKKKKDIPFSPYALNLDHKHIKEMQLISGLEIPPLFIPAVIPSYKGMLVGGAFPFSSLILPPSILKKSCQKLDLWIKKIYENYYYSEGKIRIKLLEEEKLNDGQFLSFTKNNDSDYLDIIISKSKNNDLYLQARLDNLGKGASGNAVQNLKLILNL